MRQVLFFIGCVLFFSSLLVFVIGFIACLKQNINYEKANYLFIGINLAFFFVGTYLVSNNKPEDK
jgi:hypothetical protein